MLKSTSADSEIRLCTRRGSNGRNRRQERRLWNKPAHITGALGCTACPDRHICGGLHVQADLFDCLQFCCHTPSNCDRVCRNHPDYVDRVREVETFSLDTIARSPLLEAPALPHLVPVIYHRTNRFRPATMDTVALSLYALFDHRSGRPLYSNKTALAERFGLLPNATILLTGTGQDPPLERWWEFGQKQRQRIIQSMITAGVGLVTTPNYSLFTDRPRWDNLHAIKRTAIVHEEFLRAGLPAALHVSGRTDTDFQRWADYISARPEITHLAYEFTTGTAWKGRREQHAVWLAELATVVEHPLHLVVRGGLSQHPVLSGAFSGLTVLDTSIFIKTMKRQRAYPKGHAGLGWTSAPTDRGAPLDDLLAHNFHTTDTWRRGLVDETNDSMDEAR